jgi:hypothetical protein
VLWHLQRLLDSKRASQGRVKQLVS